MFIVGDLHISIESTMAVGDAMGEEHASSLKQKMPKGKKMSTILKKKQ